METAPDNAKLDVFISYSRNDLAFAEQLSAALRLYGYGTTLDVESISGGEAWRARLLGLIRDADTVVFVLSPASAGSDVCSWEVEQARGLGKRILPIVCKPLEGTPAPNALAELNYIYFYPEPKFPGSGFGVGLRHLVRALDDEATWMRRHTRYLQQSAEWVGDGRDARRLLLGSDIALAKQWLATRPSKAAPPTTLQLEFIRASEEQALAQAEAGRRQIAEREQLLKEREAAARTAQEQAERAEQATRLAAEAQRERAELLEEAAIQQKRRYRQRNATMGLAAALAIFILGGLAYNFAKEARVEAQAELERAEQSRQERNTSNSRYTAELARQLIEKGDAGTGLNLVLEDLEPDPNDPGSRPLVSESVMTLFMGLHGNLEQAILPTQGQADIVTYASQGTLLVASDRTVLIYDPGQRTPRKRLVHEGKVLSAKFSKDGTRVLTASRDRRARIWDIAGTAQTMELVHADEVVAAAFDPSETLVATGSRDDTAAVWEAATGQKRLSLPHESDLNDVVWGDGGKRLFSITTGGMIRAFDAATGIKLLEVATGTRNTHLARIEISPDGTRGVSSGGFGAAVLWDTNDGSIIARLSHGRSHVTSAVFSPADDLIVTTGSDLRTAMWETKKGTLVYTLLDHSNVVSGSAFSPDGSRLLTFSQDRTARIYAACDGRELAVLRGHTDEIVSGTFAPDGCSVVTGSGDATVRRWGLLQRPGQTVIAEQSCVPGLGRRSSEPCKAQASFAAKRRELLGAAISPDSKWIATAPFDRIPRVYEVSTGNKLAELPVQDQPIRAVAFDRTGTTLLTGQGLFNPPGQPGLLRVWDWRQGKELIANGIPHAAAVQHVQFSPDDTRILTAAGDGQAHIFDAKTGAEILRIQTAADCGNKPCWLGSAVWSPDGKRIATASFGGSACIWDIEGKTGTLDVGALCVTHRQPVYSVAWNSRGTHIVTGSADNTAVVWDARSGEALRRFVGETFDFRWVAFFDADRQIVSANDDYSIRFWAAGTGRELARLSNREAFVNGATIDSSGERLVTASADGFARVWRLPATLEDLAASVRGSLQRCLSQQQRAEYNLLYRDVPGWCVGKLYGPGFGK